MTETFDINRTSFYSLDKTDEEKAEEKTRFNIFMNFMTDVIVKYGLNEIQETVGN